MQPDPCGPPRRRAPANKNAPAWLVVLVVVGIGAVILLGTLGALVRSLVPPADPVPAGVEAPGGGVLDGGGAVSLSLVAGRVVFGAAVRSTPIHTENELE